VGRHQFRVVEAAGRHVDLVREIGVLERELSPTPQSERTPFAVELNRAGSPWMIRKSDVRTLNQVTKGAPVIRQQIEQCQFVSLNGVPWASHRIDPQKHPPVSIVVSAR
jgi:hypothetical protein